MGTEWFRNMVTKDDIPFDPAEMSLLAMRRALPRLDVEKDVMRVLIDVEKRTKNRTEVLKNMEARI